MTEAIMATKPNPSTTPVLNKKEVDLSLKRAELAATVKNLDLPTTLILQGVLLEHAMKLTGMRKKTILDL